MTMHLLPVFFTTSDIKSKKRKVSKLKTESEKKHEAWVKKMTGGKKSDKKVLDKDWKASYHENMMVDRTGYETSQLAEMADVCVDRSLMKNLHKEPEHVKKEILAKANRILPLYNKGGLQYVTPGTDIKTVDTKSRR